MPRDLTAYLQDILDAAAAIADVMRGVSIEDYRNTRSIRSSVEREFIIIGAALRRIGDLDARLFASISNSRAIVDFRNLLAHDYGAIDDDSVFGIVYSDLIVLQAEVEHSDHPRMNGQAPPRRSSALARLGLEVTFSGSPT
jgi:uncharacterized protein with HEPN domain